jgi:ketosteroid isomerase-like protein
MYISACSNYVLLVPLHPIFMSSNSYSPPLRLFHACLCIEKDVAFLHSYYKCIRQSLRSFIDLKGKLDLKVKRVLQASDLALVITEWSYSGGTGPDGNPVNMAAKSADVLRRQQADGTWCFVIDHPWGTD